MRKRVVDDSSPKSLAYEGSDFRQPHQIHGEFKTARKELRLASRLAQKSAWRKLADFVKTDPWGLAYKVVAKNIGGRPVVSGGHWPRTRNRMGLNPTVPPPNRSTIQIWLDTSAAVQDVPFSVDKLRAAV